MITPYCIICGSIDISTVTVEGDRTYIVCHNCETQYTQTGRDVLGKIKYIHNACGMTHRTKREIDRVEIRTKILAYDIQHNVYYAEIRTNDELDGELITLQASLFDG